MAADRSAVGIESLIQFGELPVNFSERFSQPLPVGIGAGARHLFLKLAASQAQRFAPLPQGHLLR